jgi:hypothetical protein
MVDFGSALRFHKAPALLRRKEALRRVDALQGFIPSFGVPQDVWRRAALVAAILRQIVRIAASRRITRLSHQVPAST